MSESPTDRPKIFGGTKSGKNSELDLKIDSFKEMAGSFKTQNQASGRFE